MTAPAVTDLTRELLIRAVGTPARQGSKDFKGMRRGKPVLVEADDALPQWRKDVIAAAKNAILASSWLCLDGPCEVWIRVYLQRPRTVRRDYPDHQGDGDSDKYARAVLDALTLAGVYTDDSRVIDVQCGKRYADGQHRPGARIRVRPVGSQLAVI